MITELIDPLITFVDVSHSEHVTSLALLPAISDQTEAANEAILINTIVKYRNIHGVCASYQCEFNLLVLPTMQCISSNNSIGISVKAI